VHFLFARVSVVADDPVTFWSVMGNGGLGIFLSAGVAYFVARSQRGRDRKEWRETRHEVYMVIARKPKR